MKFTTLLVASLATTVSAWTFQSWRDPNYGGGLVVSYSGDGNVNDACYEINTNDNSMSSFKWNPGNNVFCSFKLYDSHGCVGDLLGSSTGGLNVGQMGTNDNRASSVWVDCV